MLLSIDNAQNAPESVVIPVEEEEVYRSVPENEPVASTAESISALDTIYQKLNFVDISLNTQLPVVTNPNRNHLDNIINITKLYITFIMQKLNDIHELYKKEQVRTNDAPFITTSVQEFIRRHMVKLDNIITHMPVLAAAPNARKGPNIGRISTATMFKHALDLIRDNIVPKINEIDFSAQLSQESIDAINAILAIEFEKMNDLMPYSEIKTDIVETDEKQAVAAADSEKTQLTKNEEAALQKAQTQAANIKSMQESIRKLQQNRQNATSALEWQQLIGKRVLHFHLC